MKYCMLGSYEGEKATAASCTVYPMSNSPTTSNGRGGLEIPVLPGVGSLWVRADRYIPIVVVRV